MKHYFGQIIPDDSLQNKMAPNALGLYAQECLQNVTKHQPNAEVPLFVVMPNHIHAIIIINDKGPTEEENKLGSQSNNLACVVRGVKIGVTKYANEYNIPFKWQPRYYDHIVRSQDELNNIAQYIENNVAAWNTDDTQH